MDVSSPARAPHPPTPRFHRPELDALRFGAFLLVFLHHALPHESAAFAWAPRIVAQGLAAAGRAGALGVDLFFALSAYLITELLLREQRATGSVNVRAFYTRRILRIWPLYFFALGILAPAMQWWDPTDHLPPSYTAAFALLSGNWACAWAGYPASSFSLLWSVSIEEQFYLAWPWLVRRHIERLRALAWAMIAVAWITRLLLLDAQHPAVWCNTLARLDPIAAGILLAGRETALRPLFRTALIGGGALGMLAIGALGDHAGVVSLWTYPLAALSAAAVLRGVLGLPLHLPPLEYLGKISFGLYVFHVAALKLAGSAVGGLALTVFAAALSYRFLETPFLRWKEHFARVESRPV
jgi:peptidoglycan/LPS O-acetylase OafA/YrhL